jgi:hypothetical protein
MTRKACFLLLATCLSAYVLTGAEQVDIPVTYRATADRLIDAALADNDGYAKLTYLCDRIGNRISDSPALERAVA